MRNGIADSGSGTGLVPGASIAAWVILALQLLILIPAYSLLGEAPQSVLRQWEGIKGWVFERIQHIQSDTMQMAFMALALMTVTQCHATEGTFLGFVQMAIWSLYVALALVMLWLHFALNLLRVARQVSRLVFNLPTLFVRPILRALDVAVPPPQALS